MTSTYTPAREIRKALNDAFRSDPAWANAAIGGSGGLLYPTWAPRLANLDLRAYAHQAELPQDPAVRAALPRLMFEVLWEPHGYEQEEAGILHGPVSVYLHVVVPRDNMEYGDMLTAAAILKVISTPLSGARIIAAELVPSSTGGPPTPLPGFNAAMEYVVGFRSANVGVLV